MIKSIIKKEWLKIKFMVISLLILSLGILLNFWYDLDFSFSTIEPESMMWYRFASLEQKPYTYLSYLYFVIAFAISIFQFIPERLNNRIKIMTHLPISMKKSLFLHLFIGIFYIFALCLFTSLIILFILLEYYPIEIALIGIKDISFYFLGSILIYLGISSAIIEKKPIFSGIKLLFTIVIIFVFHKNIFSNFDLIYLAIILVMFFVNLDSFYSIKEQRLKNIIFNFFIFLSIVFLSYSSFLTYQDKYKHEFNKYYIFYSPILKEFVYQKNFGDHQFEYGIKDKTTFDMDTYKSYLPFVYWRDLDIQKKLPLDIGGKKYTKKTIKDSRLSFSYNPSLLKKQEVQIYPLMNPKSNIGMIRFPEEMIAIKDKKINVYNFDEGLDKTLTKQVQSLLEEKNVSFPIKNIWGKATNMKPFDLGYFFLDSKDVLYKLNRYNNKLFLKKVIYPKDIKIEFMKISENKKRELAGFAIDSKNSFYLIDYKTLQFKKIELKNFNYKKMKLLFISNPKYFLLRYTDELKYYAVVFDKNLKKIDEDVFE